MTSTHGRHDGKETQTVAPRKVYLHIGLHKTGTTYLQNLMEANRDALREQGIDYPGGPGGPSAVFAVWDLHGHRPRGVTDTRIAGSWDLLVEHVNGSDLPTALISAERLSISTARQARKAVQAFPDSEVDVIVTVRDLGRVAVSAWQEGVKKDGRWSWQEYAASIRDPDQIAVNPARAFWINHDVGQACEIWEAFVPAQRIHIVTLPPRGADPDTLLRRFASVVGFDPAALPNEPAWDNASMGVAGTEVIRRVNLRLDGRLNKREHDRVINMTLAPILAQRADSTRFALPDDELAWVSERAEADIALLKDRGYPVVGDLDDLRPRPESGARRPDDATEDELLDAALDGLAMLSERYATAWWARKKRKLETMDERRGAGSTIRSWGYAVQTKAGELADRNAVAAKAMKGALVTRSWLNRRAARRGRDT